VEAFITPKDNGKLLLSFFDPLWIGEYPSRLRFIFVVIFLPNEHNKAGDNNLEEVDVIGHAWQCRVDVHGARVTIFTFRVEAISVLERVGPEFLVVDLS